QRLARERFTRRCRSSVADGVHSVTFQQTPDAANEDRFVAQNWLIHGRPWKFLAVFDGHGGAFTAEHAAANLPRLIEEELRDVLEECQRRSRNTLIDKVKKLLRQKIEDFDENIGDAVLNLCSDPSALSYPDAQDLVDANRDVFQRAFSGSTLALALIDEERNNMWVAGLGDSTVGIYWDGVRYYNVTPPYVLNAPAIRHIDLAALRQYKATLVLYTCGVDAIVNSHTRRTRKQDKPDPAAVVGTLVGSRLR
ncbi:hypothetical protein EDD18DRAFT_1081753, partial [Armillaria luteobubalina]